MSKKTVKVLPLIMSFIFIMAFSGFSRNTTSVQTKATAGSKAVAVVTSVLKVDSLMTKKADGQSVVAWGWDKPEFNKKIEDYIKLSAGVTVKGQTMSGNDEMAKVTAAAAAGAGLPDCFKFNSTDIPKLVEMNALKDITDLVAPYKNLLPKVAWDMVTYKGKIWAIPANSPAGGMFYRYDVCKKYGVDPKAITTWEQWIAAGKKVVAGSGGKVAWFTDPNKKVGLAIDSVIFQQNKAEILSKDSKVTINSSNFKNALKVMKSLRDAKISVTMDEWTAPWYQTMKDGTAACYPSGTWFVQTLIQQAPDTKGDWYFTPFPALSKGGDRYANFGSAICAISSQTKKLDAAFEWAKAWTLDKKGSLDIGLKELGISVVSNVALTDAYVNQPQPYFAENQAYWKDATEAFTKSTYIPPSVKENSEASEIWNRYLEKWWLGKATTDQALSGAEKEIKQKMKLK